MYTPGSQVAQNNSSRRTFVVTKNGTYTCVFCEAAGHSIYKCLQFAKLSPSLRLHEAKRLALCLNCLQRGHQLRVCGSSTYRVCGSKHHSLLHLSNTSSHSAASSSHNVQEAETHTSSQNILAATSSLTLSIDQHLKHDVVLLATAVINVRNHASSLVSCRALLDSESQLHIITSCLAHQIQLRKFKSTAVVSGIGDAAFSSDGFSQIDMLFGASLFFDLLCVGQIKLAAGLPILQKNRFGWVATGGAAHAGNSSLVARRLGMNPDLLLESCTEPESSPNREERDCEAHFQANFKRLPIGEYSVRLPLRLSLDQLGDSYQQALRRFLNLERKLDHNPTLKTQYAAFIKEYLDLNHMPLVSLAALSQCKYYLPHHCVLKEEVALTGDICKMYRCVRVEPADSYLQCILWRASQHQKIQTYKLDTVTYGTKPASFLSVRAIHQLAMDEQQAFPIGADIIKRDFYVDDLISGGRCVQEAVEILKQTSGLLAKGNFKLRKWCSTTLLYSKAYRKRG
ncbi:uncharacterized protein [Drosophila virilis]|uniref:uncharacterized protein n=1 Tax=Drosophila virilis TaxID=7244 RepID=UPI0038B3DE22